MTQEQRCVQKNKAEAAAASLNKIAAGGGEDPGRTLLSPFSSSSSLSDDDTCGRLLQIMRSGSQPPKPLKRDASFFTPVQIPQSQLIKIAVALLQAVAVRNAARCCSVSDRTSSQLCLLCTLRSPRVSCQLLIPYKVLFI